MPGTIKDTEVPHCFRERHICTGYRLPHQNWRYYFLSLFQRHNETINIWTHLLGFLVFLVKLNQLAETVDFVRDPHSWPLLILVVSALCYTGCSTVAHLLGSRSELCNYVFFFLDYIGVAQYQYGSAVVHFYYAVEESWHQRVHGIFMPVAAILSCLSCLGCCYGKYRNHTLPAWVRKVGQVMPSAVAYAWDTSPVFQRLFSWSSTREDPALTFHFYQVVFLLSCTFFFTYPLLERWFPGRCDFVGQSHQLFHVLLFCCTLSQIQASHLDYLGRRALYSRLHQNGDATLFVELYVANLVLCAFIVAFMIRKLIHLLECKTKLKQ
ncbi:hypothetical protein LDENG_00112100 [Lucifuga dentata]|nr:hypothetical protein LDENG_00112100 [Lucifuga dentata]